jgi:RHH-type proline utilization regulon transcriptional repressor/proline dehydrogenase/delta 1-pyrroline-5-carboxylate dehydrogenase
MLLPAFKNEAFLNFSEADVRTKMISTIENLSRQLGKTYELFSGREVAQAQRPVIQSFNPARPSQLIGSVEKASLEDAEKAVQDMARGAHDWARTPVAQRVELLEKLADWMVERKYELSALMVLEVGKTWREADADTAEAIDFCRYYAREMNRLSEPRLTQVVAGEKDTLAYFPRGVCLVIAPWNFPLAILTGMAVAGLVSGNTVIIKPAEQSPIIGAKLAQGLREVGFPSSSFSFLPGVGEEIGPKLVSHPLVDMIVFTGSADVGLSIIETAAKKPAPGQKGVKKVIAEMGGKNALIVDEDADLDEALQGAIHSAFGFQGQKCSALSRLLVHEKVYDAFVKRFAEAAANLKIGDPTDPAFQMGPVVDQEAQTRIKKTIEEAKSRLKVLFSASQIPAEGCYVPPSIFEVTDEKDSIFQREIFGPVVAVKKISSVEEGVKLVNSVPYALTGGIYSRSPSKIDYCRREMEVGNMYINRAITGAIVERHPFGGFKLSGIGSKAGGPDYLIQFMEPRTVAENTVRRGFAADS